MPITADSLRQRIETLRKGEADALATAHANAGAIALCEELLAELERPVEQAFDPVHTERFG